MTSAVFFIRLFLVQQILRNIAAVFGDLAQDFLMKPRIHPSGVGHDVSGSIQFFGQLGAGLAAVVDIEQESGSGYSACCTKKFHFYIHA